MRSNHITVIKTLQDTLTSISNRAVNVAALSAFKTTNNEVRKREGIDKIPIYKNVRFTRSTPNRATATLYIYDRAQVSAKWYSPFENATGVGFLRPVKIGGRVITEVAGAFIPPTLKNDKPNSTSKPFKRIGRSRLPIIPLKMSTLYDYYSFVTVQRSLQQNYERIYPEMIDRQLRRQLGS